MLGRANDPRASASASVEGPGPGSDPAEAKIQELFEETWEAAKLGSSRPRADMLALAEKIMRELGQPDGIGRLRLHRRASAALYELPPADRGTALDRIETLAGIPVHDWPKDQVTALGSGLFLLRIDDSLRAIVSATEGREPEVLDFVRREMLENFAPAGERVGG
jgi:hypothetical protein